MFILFFWYPPKPLLERPLLESSTIVSLNSLYHDAAIPPVPPNRPTSLIGQLDVGPNLQLRYNLTSAFDEVDVSQVS